MDRYLNCYIIVNARNASLTGAKQQHYTLETTDQSFKVGTSCPNTNLRQQGSDRILAAITD